MKGNKTFKKILLVIMALAVFLTPITVMAETHCTNNNNHSSSCGNLGSWYNNKSEIEKHWNTVRNELIEEYNKGNITWEEYISKVPSGYECWSCSYCGKWTGNFKYRDTTEPPTQHTHTWDEGVVTKEPSCTEKGTILYTCSGCGTTRTDIIDELGHNYIATVTDPTCTEDGYTTYTCSRCDNSYATDYVDSTGHSYKYEANNNGTHTKICTKCGIETIENCTKVVQGEYYVCSYCQAQYELVNPTDPTTPTEPVDPTEPSSEDDTTKPSAPSSEEDTTKPSEPTSEEDTTDPTGDTTEPTKPSEPSSEPSTDEEPSETKPVTENPIEPSTQPVTDDEKTTATTQNENIDNTTTENQKTSVKNNASPSVDKGSKTEESITGDNLTTVNGNTSETSPQTGDNNNIQMYVAVIVLTALFVFVVVARKQLKKVIER